ELDDGRFLLRDQDEVKLGDASLRLEPFLRFPGLVKYLELDPENRYLIASTFESPAPAKGDTGNAGTAAGAGSAGGGSQADGEMPSGGANQSLIRILDMQTRAVLLFSRVPGTTHLPVDGDGFYEALRGSGTSWLINYKEFHGAALPV